jgi:hypothetical protein
MTLSLLLAILATSAVVAVWGTVFGLMADDSLVRARGWAIAALGVSIGIAACGEWHHSPAARVISAVVILLGGQRLFPYHSADSLAVLSDRKTT